MKSSLVDTAMVDWLLKVKIVFSACAIFLFDQWHPSIRFAMQCAWHFFCYVWICSFPRLEFCNPAPFKI